MASATVEATRNARFDGFARKACRAYHFPSRLLRAVSMLPAAISPTRRAFCHARVRAGMTMGHTSAAVDAAQRHYVDARAASISRRAKWPRAPKSRTYLRRLTRARYHFAIRRDIERRRNTISPRPRARPHHVRADEHDAAGTPRRARGGVVAGSPISASSGLAMPGRQMG